MRQHTIWTPYVVGEAHFYSTEINGEVVLFDTGPPTPEAVEQVRREVDLDRLRHVFITHCHGDHFGLAEYLRQHTGATIYLPRLDDLKLRNQERRRAGLLKLFAEAGFDDDFGARLRASTPANPGILGILTDYQVVEESDVPARLGITCLSCPGHSQSDTVYLLDGCAVTGDLILRDLFQTPVLEVEFTNFERRHSNYRTYCRTLPKLALLVGMKILPGHHGYLENVPEAVLFYVSKLLERAARLRPLAGVEKVRDVVDALFGHKTADPFVIGLKAGEIYFMRDFLAEPQLLKEALREVGLFEPVRKLYEKAAA